MAHVPMDDVQELWKDTSAHSWSAFHDTLEKHKGKTEGISDTLVDRMLEITQDLEKSRTPYPDSPQKLYDVLNERVGKFGK
ncbi:MAG TPA: hypothetical protein VFB12_17960 [Ktedonobacteraceae bacterium]|nr:hypothetical protein [Ktedonobacteraceae bacterium]